MMIEVVKDYTFIIDGHEVTVKASSKPENQQRNMLRIQNLLWKIVMTINKYILSYSEDNNMYWI